MLRANKVGGQSWQQRWFWFPHMWNGLMVLTHICVWRCRWDDEGKGPAHDRHRQHLRVPFHTTEFFSAILIFQFLGQVLRNQRRLRKAPTFKELPTHRGARKVDGCMLQVLYQHPRVHKLGRLWTEETLCWCIKPLAPHLQHLWISLFSLDWPLETGRGCQHGMT